MTAKLVPLEQRSHEQLLKLRIFELSAERASHRKRISQIEDQLEECVDAHSVLSECTQRHRKRASSK